MGTITRAPILLPLVALAFGCAEGSSPPTTPAPAQAHEAAALFARFKAATGGAAWDAVAAVDSEGTISTGGLSGRLQTIDDVRTGRTHTHFVLGPIQGANGFDGTHPWQQDPGGEVTAHDAPEALEEARTDAWMTARGFLRPDFGEAQVSPPAERTLGGARYLVVEATPKGGRTIALWFDGATSLLSRTVMRRDMKTVTVVLDDYRAAGGVRVPFHSAEDSADATGHADPREHVDVTLARVTPSATVDPGAFAMPRMAKTARIDDPSGVTSVSFSLVNNHIYADGTIDGKPVRFLVDTGGANLLTPAAAARLGLASEGKMAASGVGAEQVDLGFARAHEVRVGAAALVSPVFYVIDLGSLAEVEGVPADGLVGFEMFRRFRVTVDYAGRTLTLAEPAKFTPPAGAHAVPFDLADRTPVVTGTLDGLPVRISVDTGARSSLTIHAPFVREHDLARRYHAAPERVTGWGVGGPSMGRPARLGTLLLGDLAITDIAGDLSTAVKGSFASTDRSANMGGGVLKRFRVSFDYDSRKMYLAPNPGAAAPDPFDRSGMWLSLQGDALVVVAVAPKGAAEKAGVAAGERIVEAGGEPAKAHTLAEWRARFSELPAGTRIPLRLSDGQKDRQVELVLADAIPLHAVGAVSGR